MSKVNEVVRAFFDGIHSLIDRMSWLVPLVFLLCILGLAFALVYAAIVGLT